MLNDESIKRNSVQAWVLAARPKTLPAALVPVLTGMALAINNGCFNWQPVALCMVFALVMQIAANFINDLLDCLRGTDGAGRLGPARACASGWVTLGAMKVAIAVTLFVACSIGLMLLRYGGLWLVLVGAACVVFAFLYTTFMSYCGLGDVLVLVFFGIVPVSCTYCLQSGSVTMSSLMLGAACGLVVDTLLVVNNFRDAASDKESGKRTLVVIMGKKFGGLLYLCLGIAGALLASIVLAASGKTAACALPLIYLLPHVVAWRGMVRTWQGTVLNAYLARTSMNMLLFALLVLAGALL